jgi:Domain of unknown function (DUF6531)
VPAPPIKTKSVYQLYFGTPMGGMILPQGNKIPVTLPNDLGLEPGKKTPLYYYDGSPGGATGEWKQGGTGTVSADGSVIITDAGSGIPAFCGVCGLPCFEAVQNEAPNPPCPDCDRPKQTYGQPVNLATGQELESAVDLVVDGEVPIVIQRTFNPYDAFAFIANYQQSLGINWTFGGYDVAMMPFAGDYSIRIVLPGNSRIDFGRSPDGKFRSAGYSSFDGAEITKLGGSNPSANGFLSGGSNPPAGPGAILCANNTAVYIVRFKDGREWRFDSASGVRTGDCLFFLTRMSDPQGRFVAISRDDRGKIQSIATSSGQSVSFSYSVSGVVESLSDHTGRTVTYNHDVVLSQGGFRGFGATTDGTSASRAAVEAAALVLGIVPIIPSRLSSVSTPEGTYAYTYDDDPPSLRLGALSFTDSSSAISTQAPDCRNVLDCRRKHGAPSVRMMSASQVWVSTSFFRVEPGEDEHTNPGIYGRAFANWLAEKLKARGEAVQEVLSEDWGWCVMLTRKPFPLWVGCSNRVGQTDEWGAFVVAEPNILARLFGRVDTKPAVDRLQKILRDVIHEIPEAKKVWVEPFDP